MPIIPNPAPGQLISAPTSRFRIAGSGIPAYNQGFQNFAQGLAKIGEPIDEIEVTIAKDGLNDAREFISNTVYDPQGEFRQTRGSAAVGITNRTAGDIERQMSEIRKGLPGRAREIFDFRVGTELDAAYRSMSNYESREIEHYRDQVNFSEAETVSNQIVLNYRSSPDELGKDIELYRSSLEEVFEQLSPTEPWSDLEPDVSEQEFAIRQRIGNTLAKRASFAAQRGDLDAAEQILKDWSHTMDKASVVGLKIMIEDGHFAASMTEVSRAVNAWTAQMDTVPEMRAKAVEIVQGIADDQKKFEMNPQRVASINAAVDGFAKAAEEDAKSIKSRKTDFHMSNVHNAIAQNRSNPSVVSSTEVTQRFIEARNAMSEIDNPEAMSRLNTLWDNYKQNPGLGGHAQVDDQKIKEALLLIPGAELGKWTWETVESYKANLTPESFGVFRDRWSDEKEALAGRKRDVDSVSYDDMKNIVRNILKRNDKISAGSNTKWKNLGDADAHTLQIATEVVWAEIGTERTRPAIRKATSELLLEDRFKRSSWWGKREESVDMADLFRNPRWIESADEDLWGVITDGETNRDLLDDTAWLQSQIVSRNAEIIEYFQSRTGDSDAE